MPCAEWYASVDSRRLSTVELKSKAFLAVDSGACYSPRSSLSTSMTTLPCVRPDWKVRSASGTCANWNTCPTYGAGSASAIMSSINGSSSSIRSV
eukprot:1189036-Prorocentrum_minimum.AAC.1